MVDFVRRNSWQLAAVAILILVTTAATWVFIAEQKKMTWWVEHTLRVINESEQALTCLIDCETAYRGYLITLDKQYLEPYETCYRGVAAHIENLRQLTVDNPEQQAIMPQLSQLSRDKIAFSQRVIAIRESSDAQLPVRELVDLKPGKILMDKFRTDIAKLQSTEQDLLTKRRQNLEVLRNEVYAGVAALTFLLLGLLLHAVVAAKKYAQQQASAKESLEKQVKERTKELMESEARFRQLFDVMPQLGWMAMPDGAVDFYNKGWYDYTGTTVEQARGFGWQEMVQPDVLPLVKQSWSEAVRTGAVFEMEFPLKRHDGVYQWFLTRANPVKDASGEVLHWVGVNTDIHFKREAREELEKLVQERTEQLRGALAEAQQANLLKSQFVATISHEVRTPMAGVIGLAEYLTTLDLEPEVAEIARHVYDSSKRLLSLLNDLLDFSKLEAGKVSIDYVAFDPRKLIEETCALFQGDCSKKGIGLTFDVLADIPSKVCADEQKTRQILINFLSNACKFTSAGSINVRAELVLRSSGVPGLRITVKDTGIGISPETQKLLFQPFIQGDGSMSRRFEGAGLGLSICKRYIDIIGGEIGFESVLGQSSSFWFTLPFLDQDAELCRINP